MQKSSSKKPIVTIIIIIVVAAMVYFYFSGDPVDTTSSIEDPSVTSETLVAGSQILALLNQISVIDIETSIFNTPVYRSLVDHTVTVLPQNVGRPNPFAPAFSATPPATSPRAR